MNMRTKRGFEDPDALYDDHDGLYTRTQEERVTFEPVILDPEDTLPDGFFERVEQVIFWAQRR